MLFSAFLTLSFGLLTLAAPQYPPSSPPGCGDPNHEAVRTPSTSDYAERPNVHPYANPHTHHWAAGKTPEYPVLFCNASETALIRQGLREAEVLAAHARDHIHRWGNASAFYTRYFGAAGTAEPAGWFDKIVHADKTGVVFRCDDPDGLCAANESECLVVTKWSNMSYC